MRFLILFAVAAAMLGSGANAGYLAGAARVQMTGPTLGPMLMGYANPSQVAQGLHMDLFARAIVIVEEESRQKVALVNVDLSQISASVKDAVIRRLQQLRPNEFGEHQVLLSATHTHAAPGGLSHDSLYTIASLGFEPDHFERVVESIAGAIIRAESSLFSVEIERVDGSLAGVTKNRSLQAHQRNPESGRFPGGVDPTVHQLNFRRRDGSLLAVWNLFSIHGTSLPNDQPLVSGDNKGWAAWRVEKRLPIVALMANGAAGDISPDPLGREEAEAIFQATRAVSEAQAAKAVSLSSSRGQIVVGPISSALLGVEMPGLPGLCEPAIGYSMLAGAEDGPGSIPGIHEGITADDLPHLSPVARGIVDLLKGIFGFRVRRNSECHEEKAVAFHTGTKQKPGSPRILPFQIVRLGNVLLTGIPFEATTVSGARIREHLLRAVGELEIEAVLLVGYANSYSGYLATPEEYELQHYEGASTHFGKNTLQGTIDSIHRLIERWRAEGPGTYGVPLEIGARPFWNNGSRKQFDRRSGTARFGRVVRNVNEEYRPGQWLTASFQAANPNHDVVEDRSLVLIEEKRNGEWITVATEQDPETFLRWRRVASQGRRDCGSCIHSTIVWRIPEEIRGGSYRIRFFGIANFSDRNRSSFEGRSREFRIRP